MLRLLTPRLLLVIVLASFGAGIVLLYTGYAALGSIGLFVAVLAMIMTAIMITTPQAAVEAGYARLVAAGTADSAPAPADAASAPPSDATHPDSTPE